MSQEAKKILFWSEDSALVRFIRFTIYKSGAVQCGELSFIDAAGDAFEWPVDQMSFAADGLLKNDGANADIEGLDHLCDNRWPAPKYFGKCPSGKGSVTFDLGSNCLDVRTYSRYQLWNHDCYTYGRGFESWDLEASVDGESWVMLDSQRNAVVNTANNQIRFTSEVFL